MSKNVVIIERGFHGMYRAEIAKGTKTHLRIGFTGFKAGSVNDSKNRQIAQEPGGQHH